jgi:hypothetical protein
VLNPSCHIQVFTYGGLDDRITCLNRGETCTFPLEPTAEAVATTAQEPAV